MNQTRQLRGTYGPSLMGWLGYEDFYNDYGYSDDFYYPEESFMDYSSGGSIDYAPYDPASAWPIDEPVPDQAWFVGNDEVPLAEYDPSQAWPIEAPPLETDFVLRDTTEAPLPPERLPDISWPVTSYVPDQWALPPFVPIFEDFTIPPPPPPPPVQQQPKLPGACPAGQYHPYPIGHPQQDVCVPFPAPPRPQQQQPRPQQTPAPRPPAQQGSRQQQQQPTCPTYCKHPQTGQWYRTPSGYTCAPVTQTCTPISQQQQACPTGQVRNPTTGQCVTVPQCPTPGTVFDARTGRCVPFAQAQQPLCPPGYWPNFQTQRCEVIPACAPGLVFDVSRGLCVTPEGSSEGDILSELKKLPWWAWAGLGALLLLGRDDDQGSGKKVTIQHRKAT